MLLLLSGWLLAAQAAELTLSGEEQQLDLAPWLAVREDPSARLRLAQVAASQAQDFRAVAPRDLNIGYSASAFWYRATLTNRAATPRQFWLEAGEPRLREVDLHLWQQGRWSIMRGGTAVPFSTRPVAALAPMFPLSLAPGESVQVLLRIASPTIMTPHIALWTPTAYLRAAAFDTLIDAMLLGAFLMAIGYSIMIAASVREPSFLYLGLAALFYLTFLVAVRGYGPMYLWPDSPWLTSVTILPMTISASVAALLYQRPLLQTAALTPLGDRCLLACCCVMAVLIPVSIFIDYRFAARAYNVLLAAAYLGLAAISVLGYIRRIQAVRTYVLAVLALVLPYVPLALHLEGLVVHPTFVKLVPLVGALLALLLWTYALHFHFDNLRRQRQHAQDELLASRATEQHRLEHTVVERTGQLQDALGQARAANQAKSMLLAHISHDLRAPLSTIIGYARQGWQHAADQTAPLAIERNARNQLTLIDDLLEYACIDLNEATLYPQAGRLPDFVHEIGEDARQLAAQAKLTFALVLDPDLPLQVEADFKRLRQVLMNLLSNSAKFTSSGGIILRVTGAVPPRILFEVIDSGVGLSEAERARIFEPFELGDARAKMSGMGLGLAISRHYVEKMGGALGVESERGHGSRFHFALDLPAVTGSAADRTETSAENF